VSDAELWTDVEHGADLKSQSVRGASVTAIAQAPKLLLTFLSQIALSRLLLPIDFGLIAMVMPVIGFVQVVADLGLTQAIVSRPRLYLRELSAFFRINMVISIGLAVMAALTGPLLAWLYGEPRIVPLTVACSLLIVVGGAGMVPGALLNRQLRFGILAAIEVAAMTMSVAIGLIAAIAGARYWSLVAMTAGYSVSQTALNWYFARWRPRFSAPARDAWSLVTVGGSITISNLAGYLNMSLDNVMIGARLGAISLGLYDRSWRLAVLPLTQIQAPFNRVAVPILSRMVDHPERYRPAFLQMTQALLLLVAPAMIFASLESAPLIDLVLGARWLPAAPIFSWLCVGAAITPVNSATFWLLVSQGRAREQMTFGTAAAIINVLAYAVGLWWGIVGVAQSSALSVYLLQSPMLVWVATRRGPVRLVDAAGLLPNLVAGGSVAAVLWRWNVAHPVGGFVMLAVTAAAAFLVYGAVLGCFPQGRARLLAMTNLWRLLKGRGQG
jgi:PST family polysaccharide transporter